MVPLSLIIVLAIVQLLYIPFALPSDARYLHVYFWSLLGMVFHARMIDVANINPRMACTIISSPGRIIDNSLST
jgi:hypothetical protein